MREQMIGFIQKNYPQYLPRYRAAMVEDHGESEQDTVEPKGASPL